MRRLIWLPLGGFLLIAGAAIAAAAVPTIVPSAPQALEAPSAAPDSDATPAPNTDTQSDDQQSDQPPFKSEGDAVAVGDVVGLVEVMKSFHEVKADAAGTLGAFLIDDEDAVMAGQAIADLALLLHPELEP